MASDNAITSDQLKLKFDISSAAEIALPSGAQVFAGAYKEARFHLDNDNPEFLRTIDEVRLEVRNFNSETDSLMSELRSETKKRLGYIATLVEEQDLLAPHCVLFPTVMRFIETQGWFGYLAYSVPIGMSLEETISSSPVRANIEVWRNDIYMLNALVFARGLSTEELGQISKALVSEAQDLVIIRKLLNRRSERKQLEASLAERLKAFSQPIHDLIYSIDTNNYMTLCYCCPTEK